MSSELHFWQGEFIDDAEAAARLADLPGLVERALTEPLPTETVLSACAALSTALGESGNPVRDRLVAHLAVSTGDFAETEAILTELSAAGAP
ncbi:hypothetical protein IPZ68_10750 [Streptomyces arenae]|nr:hypothetical protein [Streptomyces arenae]